MVSFHSRKNCKCSIQASILSFFFKLIFKNRAVKFKDFFLADQLTSLTLVMIQFQFLVCFYVHDIWRPPADEVCASKLQPYLSPYLVISFSSSFSRSLSIYLSLSFTLLLLLFRSLAFSLSRLIHPLPSYPNSYAVSLACCMAFSTKFPKIQRQQRYNSFVQCWKI